MKKLLWGLFTVTVLIVGCTNEKESVTKEEDTSQEKTQIQDEELSQEAFEKKQEEAKAEATDKVFYKWDDESTGMPAVSAYAVIKNTGKVNIDVSSTKVTFLNSNGEIIRSIGTDQTPFTSIAPSIIAPGEVAYMAISEDGGEEFSDLNDIRVDVSPVFVDFGADELEAQQTKVIKTNDWGGSIDVTGFLMNKSDTEVSALQAAAGLYNKNNKFLGAMFLSSDDTTVVPPNGKSSIQFGVPSFPADQVANVDHAEIKAINMNFE